MDNPGNLKYTKEHEWIKVEGDTAVCGITNHAQELLTDIVFVELPQLGKKIKKGEAVAALESVKSVADLFSPLSGEVIETNETLADSPEKVNKDAFESGWILKLKMSDPGEVEGLMSAEEYEAFLKE